jgi:hypothetical protein
MINNTLSNLSGKTIDFPGKLGEFIFNAKEDAVAAYKDANTPEWAKE